MANTKFDRRRIKSCEFLKIEPQERDALLWMYDNIETLRHVNDVSTLFNPLKVNAFNMGQAADIPFKYENTRKDPCGAVACIGGWMKIHMLGVKPNPKTGLYDVGEYIRQAADYVYDVEDSGKPIERLFFPKAINNSTWSNIKPKQAKRAIGNFLMTGFPKWRDAVSG